MPEQPTISAIEFFYMLNSGAFVRHPKREKDTTGPNGVLIR